MSMELALKQTAHVQQNTLPVTIVCAYQSCGIVMEKMTVLMVLMK
jgi:hypothetical protein